MILKNLIKKSKKYRIDILNHIYESKKGHLGGSLSIIDFLTVLYLNNYVDHKKNDFINVFHDNTCLLSKGHSAIAQYAILNDLNYISNKQIKNFNKNGTKIAEHPDYRIPGININSGSLGHILSQSMGICYQRYLSKNKKKIYVIMGDGELSEGSNWEAFLSLNDFSFLNNLVIIIDFNKFMTLKKINYINYFTLKNYYKKNNNISVIRCNGHNYKLIDNSLKIIKNNKKLNILFLDTIKGKGVSFMENNHLWHHKVPSYSEYQKAYYELSQ